MYSNSCRKCLRKLCTGQAAASPRAQMVWPSMRLATSSSRSSSSRRAWPASMRFSSAVHPAGALAARRALAAGLGHVEARDALEHPHHAGGLVHDDDGAGAERGAGGLQRVVVHVGLQHDLARHHRHRGAARDHRLELAAVAARRRPAPAGRRTECRAALEVAGLVHVARDREDRGAAGVLRPEVREPLRGPCAGWSAPRRSSGCC